MSDFNRRTFFKSLALTAAAIPVVAGSPAFAQERMLVPDAFKSDFQLKPLPFDASQLDGLSEKLILSHWQNNYGGSVRALNIIKQELQKALANDSTAAFVYNDLKREHLMRTGSVILHEIYFENLAPPTTHDSELDKELAHAFGSFSNWEKEFRRIGAGLGGGSGWVLLAWNTHLMSLENYWMADHMHSPVSSIPLLAMDMYEHSYQMDYGASTGQYIDAFMKNINWPVVAGRLDRALST